MKVKVLIKKPGAFLKDLEVVSSALEGGEIGEGGIESLNILVGTFRAWAGHTVTTSSPLAIQILNFGKHEFGSNGCPTKVFIVPMVRVLRDLASRKPPDARECDRTREFIGVLARLFKEAAGNLEPSGSRAIFHALRDELTELLVQCESLSRGERVRPIKLYNLPPLLDSWTMDKIAGQGVVGWPDLRDLIGQFLMSSHIAANKKFEKEVHRTSVSRAALVDRIKGIADGKALLEEHVSHTKHFITWMRDHMKGYAEGVSGVLPRRLLR